MLLHLGTKGRAGAQSRSSQTQSVLRDSGHRQLRVGSQPRPLAPHGPSMPGAVLPNAGPK